ncbi:MAG TPA: ADOP family duplicated permease [Longimicrobiales bacterium]|nr:ADOP family duplicated permease [Longimicrobiales bacterium]
MVNPPRTGEAILSLFLPGGGIQESVLGDLHEMFAQRVESAGGRSVGARWWYWTQVVGLSAGYGFRRLRGTGFRGFAPAPRPAEVTMTTTKGDGMAGMARQVRFSIRSLFRSPGFTVPSLLILAIGMTAATAIFTVVDSVVFRPLDMPDSDRLVIVCEDHPRLQGLCIASPGNTIDFTRETSTLDDLGYGRGWPYILVEDGESQRVVGGMASAGFLRAVGAQPVLGRVFNDDEFGDNDKVAVLSHDFWTSRFGADPDVLGRSVTLSGETVQIIGVLQPELELPFDMGGVQLWRPPYFGPLDPEIRGWRGFRAIGRLADGSSVEAAAAELTAVYAGIAEVHEEVDDEWRLRVEPLLRVVVGDARGVMLGFLAAAGLLLLIVCANVANLLLARGLGRKQELAVRAALGAERIRLVREIMVESLVLSAAAALMAVAFSGAATRGMLAMAPPGIPRIDEVAMDGRVLLFVVLLSAAATVLFAALPALRVTAWDLGQSLKTGARSGENRQTGRLQNGLVVAELALSVVLLSSAAMLTRSFVEYLHWEPGFERDHLLSMSAFLDRGKYPTAPAFVEAFRQMEEQVAAVPGVVSVATASAGPLFGGGDGSLPFATEADDPSGPLPSARWFDVGPGFFRTLGLPVVKGREFTEADARGAPDVVVVNETLARLAWGDDDPLGRRIRVPMLELDLEVVGVVGDVRPMVPGEAPLPEMYWSNRQYGRMATQFLIRTSGDPGAVAEAVRAAVKSVDPDMSAGTPRRLSSQAEQAMVRPRFQAVILLTFALAALILSAVGVYAVVSYAVARRTREVGIRVALGAGRGEVVRLMARSSMAVAGMGVALGLGGALFAGRLIQGLIPGVSSTDSLSLGGGAGALFLVAALAVLVPARRATRVDPVEAMRIE